MELETVNKLYLELSQVTTATTARELALVSALRRARQALADYLPAHRNEVTDAAIAEADAVLASLWATGHGAV
jgi:hypothetical protein